MQAIPPDLAGPPKDQLLEFLGQRITRRQLLAERARLMVLLAAAPAGPVLLYMPNTPAAVAVIMACLSSGRSLEILDPRQPEENRNAIRDAMEQAVRARCAHGSGFRVEIPAALVVAQTA